MRRDGADPHAQQLAYSQVPQESHEAPPRMRKAEPEYAPTQQPEPFHDPVPRTHAPSPRGRRGTPPPPAAPPRAASAPRPRRKRHPFRWFLVFLLVLVVASVAAVINLDGKLTRIDALAGYADRVGDTPGTNWLLVGSDGRNGLSPEQEQELATGGDVGPERTDTIMLVHIPKSGPATLVSLPRDSYVGIPGHGKDKLNAAFAIGGPQLLVQTVETATGLRIDHYAQIGFAGFASVVDTLGGIDVCVPKPIDDPLAGINLEAGCQTLNGPESLGFVRSRATALADIDRMNNQRLFMAALLEKATSGATLANPFTLWPLAGDTARSLKVDEDDHIWDLGRLGWAMRGDTVATTVPVGGFDDVSGSGNVLLWDKTKASAFFDALANDRSIPEELLTR
ncbi:LCP family protein [Nocardia lijiangensis]|uniref:LCP family protein n=1 Tax=Nocardia lijiangensis TaxID=299618 RepID=UPI003D757B25